MIQRALLHANDTKGSQYKRSRRVLHTSRIALLMYELRYGGREKFVFLLGWMALAHQHSVHCHCGTLSLWHCGTRQSLCAQFAFDGLPFVDGYKCFLMAILFVVFLFAFSVDLIADVVLVCEFLQSFQLHLNDGN